MSNIKNHYKLTVALGNVNHEVLRYVARDYSMDIDLEHGEVSAVTMDDNYKTYAYYMPEDEPVPSRTFDNAIDGLHDHIKNVPEEELMHNLVCDDYMCCNPDHIENQVSCQASLDSCIIVRVYQFTYYAQNCVVDAYYVKEVE